MVITVAIVVAATLLTRFSAFLIFPPGKKAPAFVQYLGKALPAAVMGMLVVYTFKVFNIFLNQRAFLEKFSIVCCLKEF